MPRDDIRLNSAPLSLFERDASESDNTRAYLVAGGRLIMRETAGRESDAFRGSKEFSPLLDDATLLSTGEKHTQKLHLYCSGIAAKMYGEAAPANYEEFQRNAQKYLQDPGYLRVLSGVVADIVSPMIPYRNTGYAGTITRVWTARPHHRGGVTDMVYWARQTKMKWRKNT